jgi:hypothetical protein
LKFSSENLKGSSYSEELGVDGRIMLDWIIREETGRVWTEFIWFRIGTSDELL